MQKYPKRIRYTQEQIISKLREAEVRWWVRQGKTVGQACKTLEISEQTHYRYYLLEQAPGTPAKGDFQEHLGVGHVASDG